MSSVDVAIVTVSYNTRDLTASCVASVLASRHRDIAVVVVDNASADGTPEHIRERFGDHDPSVTVIDSGSNLGFARACNLGARSVDSAYVLFVNPDATIDPAAIGELRAAADRSPDCGLFGGLIASSAGHIDTSTARPLPSLWSMICFGTGLSYVAKGSKVFDPDVVAGWDRRSDRSVGMLSGAMLMVRRDVWEALGGFDERYFMYGEDADLGLRAAQLGHASLFVAAARAVHDAGAASTSDHKAFLKHRGVATYLRSNWTGLRRRCGVAMLYCGVALRALSPASGEQSIDWRALWRRRREWGPGY